MYSQVRDFNAGGVLNVTGLIRSGIIYWRELRQVFVKILMIKSYERSIKPFTAALGFLGWLCPVKK
jgi:hypothetical protein